jgi:DUF1680 family protein
MAARLSRRGFLKAARSGIGAIACAASAQTSSAPRTKTPIISGTDYTPADYAIVPKRYSEVKLRDSFWSPKVKTNAEVTIPLEVRKLAQSPSAREFGGGVLEAAILSLQTHSDSDVQSYVNTSVQKMTQAPPTRSNSGFEIAAAWYDATGKRDLLDRAIRTADAIHEEFRVNNPPFSGGERDAINCIRLYNVTHECRYLDLAKHYLDIRGLENSVGRSRHNQSYKPVLEQSEAVGHAVNCVSLMVSLVDVGVLTGMRDYFDAGRRMWQDAVTSKMYATGGVGSTGNEGFGEPYSLPNISAYAETCAVLMFITLNHKLFLATGDSKYIDVMERGMYNNAIDGVSASGDRFFYVNRLASAGDGRDERWQHASLECCPPNLVRFLAGMPGYIYAQDRRDAIYVNLYVSSEAAFQVSGKSISLSVDSQMPWGGVSRITVSTKEAAHAKLKLRVPSWVRGLPSPGGLYSYLEQSGEAVRISVNGNAAAVPPDGSGYITLDRNWKDGDVVEIEFPMTVHRIAADPRVKECRGRVAIERGPVVYCADWPDVGGGRALDLLVDTKGGMEPSFENELYGGVTVIATKARSVTNPAAESKPIKLIPYFLWANRGPGEMTVWLLKAGYEIGDTGPAGGLIFYENPNYAKDGWRYLEAAPFDQSGGAKWGCFRDAISGARGTAVGTGRQNTLDMIAGCKGEENAAALSANFSLNGVRGWFLPSRDELLWMYRNLSAKRIGSFQTGGIKDNFTYWASSQDTADMAVHIDFADNGRVHSDDKDYPRRVRVIRAF